MAAAVPKLFGGRRRSPKPGQPNFRSGSLRGHGNDRPQHLLATHLPGAEPGTDGVAVFEGRIIGRIMHMTNLPRDPKPWSWSVTDPELAGRPGWANTHGEMPSRRQAMARLIERWHELRRATARS